MKNAQHHCSLENCKFKQVLLGCKFKQTRLWEWLQYKKPTIPNAYEPAEEQECTVIAGENTK